LPTTSSLFPYTTLFRSRRNGREPKAHRSRGVDETHRGGVEMTGVLSTYLGELNSLFAATEVTDAAGAKLSRDDGAKLAIGLIRRQEEHTSELQSPDHLV